jgi:hypothetical protein
MDSDELKAYLEQEEERLLAAIEEGDVEVPACILLRISKALLAPFLHPFTCLRSSCTLRAPSLSPACNLLAPLVLL